MGLRQRIQTEIEDLPTLPTVYAALSDAMANPACTADDISRIVAADQASAFRVLKVVNSAFYGFPSRIDSISQAVMIMGFDEIRNLILASSIIDLFGKSSCILDFRPSDFWAHSIAVGLFTRQIGQAVKIIPPDNLFVAGVLHDIGKLIFFELAAEEYDKVLHLASQQNISIREAEREVMEFDHSAAGTMLAERWLLPDSLKNVIAYHHMGRVGGKPEPLVAAVTIADMLARAMEFGFAGDHLVPEPLESLWESLVLRESSWEQIIHSVEGQFYDAINVLLKS